MENVIRQLIAMAYSESDTIPLQQKPIYTFEKVSPL